MSEAKLTDVEEIAQTDGKSGWLMTYADLVTLILVFFVLLFSLSKMTLGHITEVMKSYEVDIGKEVPRTRLFDIVERKSVENGRTLDQLTGMREINIFKELNSIIRKKSLGEHVEARFVDGKIILRIEGEILFETGSAELVSEAAHILSDIVNLIGDNPQYMVDIQGHTDDRPIHTAKFASNWELSAIRATTVLRFLISKGISEERLTATGFADLKPVATNETPRGRRKNRRVEIVLKEKK